MEQQNKITKSFFENKTTQEIAKQLIGKILTRETEEGIIKGIINETEAYTEEDESSHSYNGKKTKRNEPMYKDAGHLYIYFTYGMYHCANIVTAKEGRGEAVLIRSVIPIEGINLMQKNRKNIKSSQIKNLTNGPAKLCQAYNITKAQNNTNLLQNTSKIYIEDQVYTPKEIQNTTRIGISKAKHLKWRFYAKEFNKLQN